MSDETKPAAGEVSDGTPKRNADNPRHCVNEFCRFAKRIMADPHAAAAYVNYRNRHTLEQLRQTIDQLLELADC